MVFRENTTVVQYDFDQPVAANHKDIKLEVRQRPLGHCQEYSCGGGPATRDGAYHQGTVWPWLMGPYITKTFGTKAGRKFASMWLENFKEHLHEACPGVRNF